jgi:hypothetical protein
MAGVKGRSGTNKGQEKPWRDALMLAVKEATDDQDKLKLRKLAKKLVERALEGDVTALKEIGDRLDGKPRQEVEANVNETVSYVARLPVQAETVEEWQSQNKTLLQ